MDHASQSGVRLLGTVGAGELISGLKKVDGVRHADVASSLSGVMLHLVEDRLTLWATDQVVLATIPVALAPPQGAGGTAGPVGRAGEAVTAVVPGGWLGALRRAVQRSDELEIGLRGTSTLVVRRRGDDEQLVQELWDPAVQLDVSGPLLAVQGSEGLAALRGKELLSLLRSTAEGTMLGLDVEPRQLTVHADPAGRASVHGSVRAAVNLPAQRLDADSGALTAAVSAVTNLKLTTVMLEKVGGTLLKLYGASEGEPLRYSDVDCYLRLGDSRGSTPVPAEPTSAVPGDAVIEAVSSMPPQGPGPERSSATDGALAALDGIIGQPALKQQIHSLRTQVEINLRRQEQGLKQSQVGTHMVFAGPPGTGKTTVARLVARLYHELGILENEEVVEVSRTEIISENIGGTETNMRDAVERARGGVLFVDEAYAFTAEKGSNDFGPKAIEVLLKAVEDDRGSFVCILAGYTDRMKDFMAANPGLRSRFPRTVVFEPYAPEELSQIAISMARAADDDIDEGGVAELRRRLQDEESRGGFLRDDWGNARSIRNVVEQAAVHRDVRISDSGAVDRDSLVTLTAPDIAAACDDFGIGRAAGRAETVDDVLAELDAQIGQNQLKQQVRAIIAQTRVQSARRDHGLASAIDLEHLLFVGPPGTGKTTVARLLARLFRALGVLTNDDIVEVGQEQLVAGYKGQTALRTAEKIDEAMGGVLFIDEAYSLVSGGDSSFGQEAIDTLLPALENARGRFVTIAAGYPDEMRTFVASNAGLASRFTTTIEFQPYTAEELVQIAVSMAGARAETLTEGALEVLRARLVAVERAGGFAAKDWGNARAMTNLLVRAVQMRNLRISRSELSTLAPTVLATITEEDMTAACDRELAAGDAAEQVEDVLAELDDQIGQSAVKEQVRALVAQAALARRRKDAGLGTGPVALEHLLFVGPPGTGKTTIARLLGRLYRALNLLPTGHLVSATRSDLVGEHVGRTAPKTNGRVDAAIGGVLFLDEAYALVPSSASDFGREAIDTLVLRLEDDKNSFVAIAAGYPEDMKRFVGANAGLASRFTTTIRFETYEAAELALIAASMAQRSGQQITEDAAELLDMRLHAAQESGLFGSAEWGNAREMRNLIDAAMKRRDLRLHREGYAEPAEMVTLDVDDVSSACDTVLGG